MTNALFEAVQANDVVAVHDALKNPNIDVNALTTIKERFSKTPVYDAIKNNNIEIIELLITHGAHLDKISFYQSDKPYDSLRTDLNLSSPKRPPPLRYCHAGSALHCAVLLDKPDVVKYLLDNHSAACDVSNELKGNYLLLRRMLGSTAFDLHDIAKLLPFGVDFNCSDQWGERPLFHATTIEKMDFLITHGANLKQCDDRGETLLHRASMFDNEEILDYVLSLGLDVNAKSLNGETPLHRALIGRKWANFKKLIAHGADINVINEDGNTLLHYAVEEECPTMVQFLIEQQIDVTVKDKHEYSPMQYAIGWDWDEISYLLATHTSKGTRIDERFYNALSNALYWERLKVVNFFIMKQQEYNALPDCELVKVEKIPSMADFQAILTNQYIFTADAIWYFDQVQQKLDILEMLEDKSFSSLLNRLNLRATRSADLGDLSLITLFTGHTTRSSLQITNIRKLHNTILSNSKSDKLMHDTQSFADYAYQELMELALLHPINFNDCITGEEILEDNIVFVSTGYQFDIYNLIQYHNERFYQGSFTGEEYTSRWLLNPLTNEKFSLRDSHHIQRIAAQKNIEIKYLKAEIKWSPLVVQQQIASGSVNQLGLFSSSSSSSSSNPPERFEIMG